MVRLDLQLPDCVRIFIGFTDGPLENGGIRCDTVVRANTTTASGGGVHSNGTLAVYGSRFEANIASTGGAVWAQGGSAAFVDSRFTGNTGGSGGAMFVVGALFAVAWWYGVRTGIRIDREAAQREREQAEWDAAHPQGPAPGNGA